jgi:hypothetical protein
VHYNPSQTALNKVNGFAILIAFGESGFVSMCLRTGAFTGISNNLRDSKKSQPQGLALWIHVKKRITTSLRWYNPGGEHNVNRYAPFQVPRVSDAVCSQPGNSGSPSGEKLFNKP